MMNIGFIGAGNMASALIEGLLSANYSPDQLRASDPRASELSAMFGIQVVDDNPAVTCWADVVILAVKPQTMRTVCRQVADQLAIKRPLLISIAAGIDSQVISHWLGAQQPLVRVMSNTPAMIGKGMSGLYANALCSDEQRALAEQIMSRVGEVVWVSKEKQMQAITAVSGSGPAYFLLLIEEMIKAAVDQGLSKQMARQLVLQTAVGASVMAFESKSSPEQLRRQITSPGGTTEQAIGVFQKGGFSVLVNKAIAAATDRAAELSKSR